MLDTIAKPRQPMLWAAVALACGIAVGGAITTPAVPLIAAAAAFAVAAVIFATLASRVSTQEDPGETERQPTVAPASRRLSSGRLARSYLAFACAMFALASVGVVAIHARTAATPDLAELRPWADGRELTIAGHVVREGTSRTYTRYAYQSVEIQTAELSDGASTLHLAKRIRLSVYDNYNDAATTPELHYGDRVRVIAKLREPRNFGNPGAWDYRGYLLTQGIVALASARADRIERLDGFAGSKLVVAQMRARRAILERISALWPREEAALLAAMLIGDRTEIGRATDDAWQRSGVYHVLVVSGMNVGLLALAAFWILKLLRAPHWLATLVTILLGVAYAFLADLGAPIVRATLMIAVYLVARLLYRDRAVLNGLGAAAVAILAFDPHALFEPSFQLTFLAVAAIAGIAIPLVERTSWSYSRALRNLRTLAIDPTLAPRVAQFRVELRMLSTRVARVLEWLPIPKRLRTRLADAVCIGVCSAMFRVFELLVVSALMQSALALPMATYFHRAPLVALPANLLATPVTSLLMVSAALALLLNTVSTALAAVPAHIASAALGWMTTVVSHFGALDAANIRVPRLPAALVFACALTLALALLLSRARRAFAVATLVLLAASAAIIAAYTSAPDTRPDALEVTAIDVGQADSLLVVTPEGKTLLVDAAGAIGGSSEFDFGEEVVSPYLWARGFSRLDAVALTHAHSDHMGGMRAVIENFRPKELWLAASLECSSHPPLVDLIAFARSRNTRIRALVVGENVSFGGARFRTLAPAADDCAHHKPRNEDSLVLKVTYGTTSALLTGDAERAAERMIIMGDARADLLKVAHNGSKTSTSPELLAAVRPRFAVISVGARNPYGHPRPEVLSRLADASVHVYRTDQDGAVSFFLDGERVTPVPWTRR